jgi:hypothetical protein
VSTVEEPLLAVLVVAGADHVLRPERGPAAELLADVLLHAYVTSALLHGVLRWNETESSTVNSDGGAFCLFFASGVIEHYPFDVRRLVGGLVDAGAADEQELPHASGLRPVRHRPACAPSVTT